MSTSPSNTNPTTVNIVLTTPPNPSSAYRAMLTTLDFLKSAATDELFGATSADFEIDNDQIKFTAEFVDNISGTATFAIYLEALLRKSLSGERLTDEQRWTRIQRLAALFNKRYADGWGVVRYLLPTKDVINALSVMTFETEAEAVAASRIYKEQLGEDEPIILLHNEAKGFWAASPVSHLMPATPEQYAANQQEARA
jgi:hypothetical protein